MSNRIFYDCAIGLAFLSIVLSLLICAMFFPDVLIPGISDLGAAILVVVLLSPPGHFVEMVVWLAFIGVMVVYGLTRGRPGYALAPVAFFVVWFAASVISRGIVAYSHQEPVDQNRSLAKARNETTLIVGRQDVVRPKLLADGPIRRMILVDPGPAAEHPRGIEEETIQHGTACGEWRFTSYALIKAGRADECFRRTPLTSIPDGLEVQTLQDIRIETGDNRRIEKGSRLWSCCESVVVSLRRSGKAEPLATLSTGWTMVPSYFPLFFKHWRPVIRPTSLWERGDGPLQAVTYGHYPATTESALKTIFGVDPAAPLARAKLDPAR